jgi:DNA polymerase-3 subunit delta
VIPPQIAGLLKGPKAGGAFFLFGEEEYQKDAAARAIQDAYLDPATADFNLDRLRGSEVTLETLASVMGTPPMMAEWRIVVVREAEAFAGKPSMRTALLDVVRQPPPGLVLILTATIPSGSKARFYSDLRKATQSAEFRALGPDDAPGWLMGLVRERFGREIEPDAAVAVVAALGPAMGPLAAEAEKLVAVAEDGAPITLDVVRAAGTHVPFADRWGWIKTVGSGDFQRAIEELPVLLSQGESGVGLTIALATQLLRLGVFLEGGRGALEAALPPHQRWLAGQVAGQAGAWSRDRLSRALLDLETVDRQLKRSPLGDEQILGSWLLARATEGWGPEEVA